MGGPDAAIEWASLPLFPLNTVLFPGMMLPLHVFEDRYRTMINRCVDEEHPFGVLLIREGKEVGGPAVPYEVGTTAAIAAVNRLSDGRMSIIAIGGERFRLRAIYQDLPYMVGDAEPWPLTGAATERARELVGPVRALFQQYLSLLAQAQGHKIEIEEIPNEPRMLALLIGIALQLPMPQKQRLLDQPTVAHMLWAERAIMRREQLLLGHIIRTQTDQWEGGYSGYLARN
jgi:Lon protease-like protein